MTTKTHMTETTEREGQRVLTVSVHDIAASPDNTRLFDTTDAEETHSLEELAASIKATGMQQYPKVRPATEGTQPWVVVFGERRLRAVRDILGWSTITVLVDESLDRTAAAALTVVENLQRRNLHPIEEARGIAIMRGQGVTVKDIAAHLGRREEWVKERLKLCDLPSMVQDIYRRAARLTLQQVLALHEYTHGGPDNAGFPDLMIALAENLEAGGMVASALATVAATRPELVVRITQAYHDGAGRWGGHYFDTKRICTRCPFAAYRPGPYEGVGSCLLPTHYTELQAKGKKKYDIAQERAAATAAERGETSSPALDSWQPTPTKSAAQKGKETRARHLRQKADYAPTVAAIERLIDMIANVDGIDVAVLCAYTLTSKNVESTAIEQVMTRHGLTGFPDAEPTPTTRHIERLRALDPASVVRYTLEALLLTQARRARDYDPGKATADPVLALYLPGQAPETTGGVA